MPKKGDDLDTITTGHCINHLSNATATIKSVDHAVIFDNEEVIILDAVVNRPVMVIATDQTTGLVKNEVIVINGKNYQYDFQQDDGTGISRVILKNT